MNSIKIDLDLEDEKFILKIGGQIVAYSDFYFFVWDHGLEEQKHIVLENQILNLKSWKFEITNLTTDDDIFLPFDFSDQYLGCLVLAKKKEVFEFSYGFFAGLMALPSYCRPLKPSTEQKKEFIQTNNFGRIDVIEALEDLEANVQLLENHLFLNL